MPIDQNAMALFVRVVEAESFSGAGRKAGIPVSTVSRKIANLEKALGVRLLERSTRALRMTDIGEAYFERCRRGLEEFEAANAVVTDRQQTLSGRLRISAPPSLSDVLIVPLVGGFQESYPNVSVRCLVTDRHVDHIADAVDLSLRVGDLPDSSLVCRRLLCYRSVLVASPGYIQQRALPTHPDDLASHVIVAFARWNSGPIRWSLERRGKTQRVKLNANITLNDYAGVRRAVVDGRGVSEIPSIVCNRELRDGSLIEIMPEWRFEPVSIAAVYPSKQNLSRLVRLFRDYCVDHFKRFAPNV